VDLVPLPLRAEDAGAAELFHWVDEHMRERGWAAAASTLAISVLAIALSQVLAWMLAPLAARNFADAQPMELAARAEPRSSRLAWSAVRGAARAAFIALRAIPEYVLAFLLLSVLGSGVALPLVL